jgi:hypothetical protein
MNNALFRLAGVAIILFGIFGKNVLETLTVLNEVEVVNLGLSQPSENVSSAVSKVADIVTVDEDRLSIAIFNMVCADRMANWSSFNQQEFNDIYVSAAKNFFGDSMRGKYEMLDEFLVEAIMEVTGEELHSITAVEKQEIINRLNGIAWFLTN